MRARFTGNTDGQKNTRPHSFEFKFFEDTWTVRFVDRLPESSNDDYWWGVTNHSRTEIVVATKDIDGKPYPVEKIRNSLAHEIVHVILGTGGWLKENDNEALVEWLAKGIVAVINEDVIGNERLFIEEEN